MTSRPTSSGRAAAHACEYEDREPKDEAHLPAKHPQACPQARISPPDVDPRRSGDPQSSAPARPCQALCVISVHRQETRSGVTSASSRATELRQVTGGFASSAFRTGSPSWRCAVPGAVPGQAPCGYTTSRRYLETYHAESRTPYPVGSARRRRETGADAVSVK